MLEEINIKNYALIDCLSLSFQKGFNILTGETGAGKSIIVGSLSFLLGARSDADVIRSGADEASVSAVVSIDPCNNDAVDWLNARDIGIEDERVIVRRNIKQSGRNNSYIQNVQVTRSDLAEFMAFLFDLHGQHSHESLINKESHRKYLDNFAGLGAEVAEFGKVFSELAEKRSELAAQTNEERVRETKLEMLRYAVDEIAKADPSPGETQKLENEASRLNRFEKLSAYANNADTAFLSDENSILSMIRKARSSIENAAVIDGALAPILKRVESLYFESEDVAEELRSYLEGLKYEPGRLEEVEERLGLLFRLKKKYGTSKDAYFKEADNLFDNDEDVILAYKAKAEAEIEALLNIEENSEKLKKEIGGLEKEIAARASALSRRRREAGAVLGEKISAILVRLGMPRAVFAVNVAPKGTNSLVCGPNGADNVEFLISANAGEPPKDLSRVASGGELSRVMLAVKTVLSDADALETLVFDEIDTGIGGEVALAVGEYLAKIGKLKQIFCVTHLASIAVRADNHLKVEKKVENSTGRTVTGVITLKPEERRLEIARMLAGDAGSAAVAHADEILLKYGVKQ
ncbi:MAG: DNA repair protein RecN [Treponema sp.]|jgi:DNA repair protein RecN (Recombination protein N)|nr:DNA repair protein RecN [Treponema sp.]